MNNERAKKSDPDYADPGNCGCWYCFRKSGELCFDTEFDTYVHKKCVERRLSKHPHCEEAKIIARSIGVDVTDDL